MDSRNDRRAWVLSGWAGEKEDTRRGIPYQFYDINRNLAKTTPRCSNMAPFVTGPQRLDIRKE